MNETENFDEYMSYYKELPLKEKQGIIMKQLKMLASFTNSLCKEIGVDNEMVVNKELLDIEVNEYTEDDFSEAVVVLLNSVQNSICDFHDKFSTLINDKMN